MKTTRYALPFLLLLVPAGGCANRSEVEPLRIGHLAAFTGPDRSRGEQARRGLQLALNEEWQELEKLIGRKVVFLHVDHRGDPAVLQAEAVRLVTVNKVKALIADCDPALGELLARSAQAQGVPALLTSDLSPPRSGILGLGLEGALRGKALARFAREELKANLVAVLTPRRGGQVPGLVEAFVREWQTVKAAAIYEWNWERETDLPELALRVASSKPAAILVGAGAGDLRRIRTALESASVKVPLLFGGADTGPDTFRVDPLPAGGLVLASAFATEGLTDAGREAASRFENAFQRTLDLDAAQGYVAARCIFEALRRSRQAGGLSFHDALEKLDTIESLTGPLTFRNGITQRPGFLLEMKNGTTRLVKTLPDEVTR